MRRVRRPFAEVQIFFAPLLSRLSRLSMHLSRDSDLTVDWSPSADISETEKEYVIRTQLLDVRREDVKVHLQEGMVTIAGDRKQENEQKTENFHRVESVHGGFTRGFALPDALKPGAACNDWKDAVLTVHIPKV